MTFLFYCSSQFKNFPHWWKKVNCGLGVLSIFFFIKILDIEKSNPEVAFLEGNVFRNIQLF